MGLIFFIWDTTTFKVCRNYADTLVVSITEDSFDNKGLIDQYSIQIIEQK